MAIVRYTLEMLPPVSQEELDRVHAIRDEDIDCSDMPEIGRCSWLIPRAQYEAWKKARLEAVSKLEAVNAAGTEDPDHIFTGSNWAAVVQYLNGAQRYFQTLQKDAAALKVDKPKVVDNEYIKKHCKPDMTPEQLEKVLKDAPKMDFDNFIYQNHAA